MQPPRPPPPKKWKQGKLSPTITAGRLALRDPPRCAGRPERTAGGESPHKKIILCVPGEPSVVRYIRLWTGCILEEGLEKNTGKKKFNLEIIFPWQTCYCSTTMHSFAAAVSDVDQLANFDPDWCGTCVGLLSHSASDWQWPQWCLGETCLCGYIPNWQQ